MSEAVGDSDRGVLLDERGQLLGDLPCVKCQYNLRTLHRDAACPECGTAVGRSIEGNRLRYCDPMWLKQIWEGLNCFGLAVVAAIGLVVATTMSRSDTPLLWIVIPLSTMLGLAIYGLIKATRRDPARIDRESPINARLTCRVLWAATLIFLGSLLLSLAMPAWLQTRTTMMWQEVFAYGAMFCMLAGTVAVLIHAALLAGRLPNRPLMFYIVFVMVYLVVLVMLTLLVAWEWVWSIAGIYDLRYWIVSNAPLFWLGFAAELVMLLAWYWWALSRAARFAWATWARKRDE